MHICMCTQNTRKKVCSKKQICILFSTIPFAIILILSIFYSGLAKLVSLTQHWNQIPRPWPCSHNFKHTFLIIQPWTLWVFFLQRIKGKQMFSGNPMPLFALLLNPGGVWYIHRWKEGMKVTIQEFSNGPVNQFLFFHQWLARRCQKSEQCYCLCKSDESQHLAFGEVSSCLRLQASLAKRRSSHWRARLCENPY